MGIKYTKSIFKCFLLQGTSVLLALGIMHSSSGCGTWIGNPQDENPDEQKASVNIAVEGTAPAIVAPTLPVKDVAGNSSGTVTLDEAKVVIKEIAIKLKDADSNAAVFPGPFLVDLLSNQITPDPSTLPIAPGTYDQVLLKLHVLTSGEIADLPEDHQSIGRSIYLKGTYTNLDGTAKPLTMSFDLEEDLVMKNGGTGFDITKPDTPLIIAFRLARWFKFDRNEENEAGIDLTQMKGDTIDLNETSVDQEKTLRELIKENIESSLNFGIDEDEDGQLGDHEDEDEEEDEDDDD